MLDLIRKGRFSRNFSVLDGSVELGEIRMSRWRDGGEIVVGGRRLGARRTQSFGRGFALEADGLVVAKATRPSLLSQALTVEADERTYVLAARWSLEWATSVFELRDEARVVGVVVCEESFFRRSMPRRAVVELPTEISTEARLFIVWLVLYNRS